MMSHITDFLPQYRELNALFTNVVSRGTINYSEQKMITDFYRQSSDVKVFEKIILDIVLEKDKSTCTLLLSGIKTEVQNNIRLYESAKDLLDSIDTMRICSSEVKRYDPTINYQLKNVQEHLKEVKEIDGELDSVGFREHSQWEEDRLWKQRESAKDYYDKEKIILKQLYDEKIEFQNETSRYTCNLFNNIYSLSLAFLKIVNCYIVPKASVIEEEEATEEITEEIENKIDPPPLLTIEPDMIFKTKSFDKLLILEQKLINDKYLSKDLHWVSTHDNGKTDIRKLVTFLTALIDNNYFLPNRDPKIKTFFESRYHISIGQNFEKRRREPLVAEYKVAFYDYPF